MQLDPPQKLSLGQYRYLTWPPLTQPALTLPPYASCVHSVGDSGNAASRLLGQPHGASSYWYAEAVQSNHGPRPVPDTYTAPCDGVGVTVKGVRVAVGVADGHCSQKAMRG
jgi:hypothetical protein